MTHDNRAPVTARRVLGRAVTGQGRHVLAGCLLMVTWQAGEALVPVVIGATVDRAIAPGDGRAITGWLAVLAAVFAGLSLSFRFASRHSRAAAEWAAHGSRIALTAAILRPGRRARDHRSATGRLVSIAQSDTDRVGALGAALARTCGALASVAVATAVLVTIAPLLALIVPAGAIVLLAATRWLGAPLRRRAALEQEHAAHAVAAATDLVRGLRVLTGLGAGPAAADRYRAASRRSLAATIRSADAEAAYDAVTLLLTLLFLVAVTGVAGHLALAGRVSIGAFIAAVGLAQFLLGPMAQLAATGTVWARAHASAERIATVHAAERIHAPAGYAPAPAGTDLAAEHGPLRLAVAEGELVGIVAEPAGATALADLLAAPPPGTVRVGGVAVDALDPATAPATLLVAAHHSHLFAQPIRTLIRAGRPDGTDLTPAITAAGADEIAGALPDGLDTVLTEAGRNLSGGQQQRLALARALAADPAVLVLHDPTTAVDAVTEIRIADALRRLRAGRTTVLITTSPALLDVCDRVLLIEDAAVVDGGRHRDLAERRPAYRTLVLA